MDRPILDIPFRTARLYKRQYRNLDAFIAFAPVQMVLSGNKIKWPTSIIWEERRFVYIKPQPGFPAGCYREANHV